MCPYALPRLLHSHGNGMLLLKISWISCAVMMAYDTQRSEMVGDCQRLSMAGCPVRSSPIPVEPSGGRTAEPPASATLVSLQLPFSSQSHKHHPGPLPGRSNQVPEDKPPSWGPFQHHSLSQHPSILSCSLHCKIFWRGIQGWVSCGGALWDQDLPSPQPVTGFSLSSPRIVHQIVNGLSLLSLGCVAGFILTQAPF